MIIQQTNQKPTPEFWQTGQSLKPTKLCVEKTNRASVDSATISNLKAQLNKSARYSSGRKTYFPGAREKSPQLNALVTKMNILMW